jgi:hypothetical protein
MIVMVVSIIFVNIQSKTRMERKNAGERDSASYAERVIFGMMLCIIVVNADLIIASVPSISITNSGTASAFMCQGFRDNRSEEEIDVEKLERSVLYRREMDVNLIPNNKCNHCCNLQ